MRRATRRARKSEAPGALHARPVNDGLWAAMGLVLVFEGLLPFASPAVWRQVFERALQLSDAQLRAMGAVSMVLGLLLLFALR